MKGYFQKILKKLLKKFKKEILFSCVVPLALKEIKKIVKKSNYKVLEIKNLNFKKLIKINIKM